LANNTVLINGKKLTTSCKSKSIYKLYINDEWEATGNLNEISEQIGISKNALNVALSRSRNGIAKRKIYRLELLEEIRDSRIFNMYKDNVFIATGTLVELSEITGYYLPYLKRRASSKGLAEFNKRIKGIRNTKPICLKQVKPI